jgi:hypothetical protein
MRFHRLRRSFRRHENFHLSKKSSHNESPHRSIVKFKHPISIHVLRCPQSAWDPAPFCRCFIMPNPASRSSTFEFVHFFKSWPPSKPSHQACKLSYVFYGPSSQSCTPSINCREVLPLLHLLEHLLFQFIILDSSSIIACQRIVIFAKSPCLVYPFGSATRRAEVIVEWSFVASAIMFMFMFSRTGWKSVKSSFYVSPADNNSLLLFLPISPGSSPLSGYGLSFSVAWFSSKGFDLVRLLHFICF